jgi:signal transduction histidine kinase
MDSNSNETRLGRLLAVLQKGLNHELANQLVAVRGLTRLLELEEGERLSAEGRGYLERVAAGTAKAHALVSALAELARLGRPAAEVETVDLAGAVAEAVAEAKQLAPGCPAEYHGTIPALLGVAPRPALRKVLVHLLRRAGTTAARVEVSARSAAATGAELRIAGDGPAISPEQVARLFEPFTGPEGHGLDLFLARELAEGWGGALGVESTGGSETAFVVTCPLSSLPRPSKTTGEEGSGPRDKGQGTCRPRA